MSQIQIPNTIISGDADNPTRDMANWTIIRDIINGNLDNTNLSASAAIAISKTALGTFTDWTAWTPTLSSNPGTWTTTTIHTARYMQIGKVVIFQVWILGTSVSDNTTLRFTLPITPANTTDFFIGGGCGLQNASSAISGMWVHRGSNVIHCFQYGGAAFANAAGCGVLVNGSYEVS